MEFLLGICVTFPFFKVTLQHTLFKLWWYNLQNRLLCVLLKQTKLQTSANRDVIENKTFWPQSHSLYNTFKVLILCSLNAIESCNVLMAIHLYREPQNRKLLNFLHWKSHKELTFLTKMLISKLTTSQTEKKKKHKIQSKSQNAHIIWKFVIQAQAFTYPHKKSYNQHEI